MWGNRRKLRTPLHLEKAGELRDMSPTTLSNREFLNDKTQHRIGPEASQEKIAEGYYRRKPEQSQAMVRDRQRSSSR